MDTSSTTPATKPQPVVVYGAAIAAATSLVGGLTVLFKDNPTVTLVLGVASVVVGAAAIFKDQIVKGMVVPVKDTVAYVNDQRQVVTGPASPLGEGEPVHDVIPGDDEDHHDGRDTEVSEPYVPEHAAPQTFYDGTPLDAFDKR